MGAWEGAFGQTGQGQCLDSWTQWPVTVATGRMWAAVGDSGEPGWYRQLAVPHSNGRSIDRSGFRCLPLLVSSQHHSWNHSVICRLCDARLFESSAHTAPVISGCSSGVLSLREQPTYLFSLQQLMAESVSCKGRDVSTYEETFAPQFFCLTKCEIDGYSESLRSIRVGLSHAWCVSSCKSHGTAEIMRSIIFTGNWRSEWLDFLAFSSERSASAAAAPLPPSVVTLTSRVLIGWTLFWALCVRGGSCSGRTHPAQAARLSRIDCYGERKSCGLMLHAALAGKGRRCTGAMRKSIDFTANNHFCVHWQIECLAFEIEILTMI